jgi:thiol-disulfide isomerase/thioredoxin
MNKIGNRFHYLRMLPYFLCLFGLLSTAGYAGLEDSLKEIDNRQAPKFQNVQWVNNSSADSKFLSGKVVLVNFWATWCPPCVEELPSIQKVWKSHSREEFEVVAVNVGEKKDDIEKFLTETGMTLEIPIVLDKNLDVYKQWKVNPLPTSFLIDRNGRFRYRSLGGRNFNSDNIRAIIQNLIDE